MLYKEKHVQHSFTARAVTAICRLMNVHHRQWSTSIFNQLEEGKALTICTHTHTHTVTYVSYLYLVTNIEFITEKVNFLVTSDYKSNKNVLPFGKRSEEKRKWQEQKMSIRL